MLDRFYLIVDKTEWLEQFLPLGVRCVQLRIKNQSQEVVRQEIRHAIKLCEASGCQLIINDYWQLAIEEGGSAVHLGQEDLDTADTDALTKAGIRYGISTHDRAELNRALRYEPAYIALGPVYATILKKMPWRPQGLEKLGRWKASIGDIPLVAIGGFTPERAAGAFEHGADSVCVVTDVLLHEDPCARIKEWLRATSA
ncbi:MAG: thiamine phosphate synthase [Granulosicoccus sp.]